MQICQNICTEIYIFPIPSKSSKQICAKHHQIDLKHLKLKMPQSYKAPTPSQREVSSPNLAIVWEHPPISCLVPYLKGINLQCRVIVCLMMMTKWKFISTTTWKRDTANLIIRGGIWWSPFNEAVMRLEIYTRFVKRIIVSDECENVT